MAGNLTATIEQLSGGQSRRPVDILVAFPQRQEASPKQLTQLAQIANGKESRRL
jgi:hypothetical protein